MSGATETASISPGSPGPWAEIGRSWMIVVAAVVAICLYSLPGYSFNVFVGPLTEFFGKTKTEVTAWSVSWSVGCIAASPLVGILADRFGARRMLLFGMPVYALAILLTALLSTELWELLVGAFFVSKCHGPQKATRARQP